jgi:hypothetical protein
VPGDGGGAAALGVDFVDTADSAAAGRALGIVGLFVIPIVGALIGFVLGVYLAERTRLGSHDQAWPSTKAALSGALVSIAIGFVAAALCGAIWPAGAVGAF